MLNSSIIGLGASDNRGSNWWRLLSPLTWIKDKYGIDATVPTTNIFQISDIPNGSVVICSNVLGYTPDFYAFVDLLHEKNCLVIYDIDDDVYVTATSLHHQMLQFNKDMDLIACTKEQVATSFETADTITHVDKDSEDGSIELEIEAGCYALTKCFFVQGHPEIGNEYYRSWTMNKLFTLMMEWGSSDPVADDPYEDGEGVAA